MPYKDREKAKASARRTMAKRRATDPKFVEDRKVYMLKWHKDNPEANERKNSARNKKYAEDTDYRIRAIKEMVLRRYKMTVEQYVVSLEEQGGHCALCSTKPEEQKHQLHVDHDHKCCPGKGFTCGKCNRGILCQACNTRIGYLEQLMKDFVNFENSEIYVRNSVLEGSWTSRALQYLKRYAE
jgi:hypothetical protein